MRWRRARSAMRRDVPLPGAGLARGLAQALLGMSTGIRDDFRPEQGRTPATTTPTQLAGWVYDELLPIMGA